jgi:hypothetical protein
MARKKAKEVVEDGGGTAGNGEAGAFAKRLIEDTDMRETIGRALESSRRAYERVSGAKKPSKLLDDKKLQADVQEALEAFRDAASGLTAVARENQRKGRRLGRKLMILGLGGGLALAGSEQLRSKVLDTLFGAEEEFEYTPPAPAAPPPSDVSEASEPPASAG